jgi:hypothetical protein
MRWVSEQSRDIVPKHKLEILGLGGAWGCDAFWAEALLRQRRSAFYYLQLLPAVASVEDGACARPVCAGVGKSARRDGISPGHKGCPTRHSVASLALWCRGVMSPSAYPSASLRAGALG